MEKVGILDIVIPHLNYHNWARNIKSLIRNTPEGVLNKIFIIDQNPDAHRLWDKAATNPKVVVIHCKNQGFAKAMNTGLRLSDAPYVMCLNDDVTFINKRWWQGILDTFEKVPNALCVNPASMQDPDGRGGKVVMEGFEFHEDFSEEEYDRALLAKGPGYIDGICMWGPVFKREMLDKVPGVVPGKAWFDELFFPGGGEDYDLNRRGYLAGMRSLGTNHSIVWHEWYGTKSPTTGTASVKHDGGTFEQKWTSPEGEKPDIMGNVGLKEVPMNLIREDL
jgi:GT2 family glycosyltransferase